MSRKNIFISHSWKHKQDYFGIRRLLNNSGLKYSDYSVPKHDSFDVNSSQQLNDAIRSQIKRCSCVLVAGGVYATNSAWMKKEIQMAKQEGKPIITVKPRGSERTSSVAKKSASDVVGILIQYPNP